MSLLYESIQAVIAGGMLTGSQSDTLAMTCVVKLRTFLEETDQNCNPHRPLFRFNNSEIRWSSRTR